MAVRTIVVGDVHGCLEELDELVRLVRFRAGFDRLCFVGDLVDRGPDSIGVLRRVRELGGTSVLGNHEAKHLRWARHGVLGRSDPSHRNPLRPISPVRMEEHHQLSERDLAWLATLPPVLRLGRRWAVIHGGLSPRRPLDAQLPEEVIRMRLIDAEGRMVPQRRTAPPHLAPWSTRWAGPESILYGHHVHGLEVPHVEEPSPGVRCVGLDTGCCYGGRLSAVILPTEEVVSVPARAAYASRR